MIDVEKQHPNRPVNRMCGWAGVSESGFYAWVRREPSATTQRRAELAVQVTEVFEASNGVYGYRKVHAVLAAKDVAVCDRVVREIMAEQGLTSCHPGPVALSHTG